jgi:hypothetical protein
VKKWKITLCANGQLRETIVYAATQAAAITVARVQYAGAEVRSAVEVGWTGKEGR